MYNSDDDFSFNYLGHRWRLLFTPESNTFATAASSLSVLRSLGRQLDFNIDNTSDIIYNLENEIISYTWNDFFDMRYNDLVNLGRINRGEYYLEIVWYLDSDFRKLNKTTTIVKILKVGDSSFSRVYKNMDYNPIMRFGP